MFKAKIILPASSVFSYAYPPFWAIFKGLKKISIALYNGKFWIYATKKELIPYSEAYPIMLKTSNLKLIDTSAIEVKEAKRKPNWWLYKYKKSNDFIICMVKGCCYYQFDTKAGKLESFEIEKISEIETYKLQMNSELEYIADATSL